MTNQLIELQTINDQELQAAAGGWALTGGNFMGGIQTGINARTMGVDLGNQGAGAFAVGALIGQKAGKTDD